MLLLNAIYEKKFEGGNSVFDKYVNMYKNHYNSLCYSNLVSDAQSHVVKRSLI